MCKDLKKILVSSSVLITPDFTTPFKLYTDASGTALGAILAQDDEHGVERVVAYGSRSLTILPKSFVVDKILAKNEKISETNSKGLRYV